MQSTDFSKCIKMRNINRGLFLSTILFISVTARSISFEEDVTLTSAQKEALEKFKEIMNPHLTFDYMKEDIYLIKWLRSRNFDIKQAEAFLKQNLQWRKDQKMDDVNEEDFQEFKTGFPYYVEAQDKYAKPFMYIEIGQIDIRKPVIEGKMDKLLRYVDHAWDRACTRVRLFGEKYKNVTRGHLILNADGYNLVQHGCLRCVPFLLRIFISYENHFPECADKIIVINAPSIVEPLLNLARPVLSPETSRSLQVFGTDKRRWQAELAKDFDPDQLPRSIGGTAVYTGMDDFDY